MMPIANPYRITNVRDRHEVYVTFGLDEFAVNASVQGGHGTVNPATQSVFYGGTASIDLTPDTGYRVASVTDNGSSMPVADPYVINNVNAIHNVVVAFTASSYNVTASVHGGNGTAIPASQAVAAGGTAAIILNPATGYELATISDNGSEVPPSSPYVITNVSRDHDVVATFNPGEYTVTATVAGGNGTVTPSTQTVAYGGTASIDLTPDTGYHAATITDTGVSRPVSDPYVINNVTAIHDVVVTFEVNQYAVTASVDGANGTALPATQNVVHGGTASIAISADSGYHIATITDNGVSMPTTSNPYVITGVTADHTVIVTFANTNYMVAAVAATRECKPYIATGPLQWQR